MNRWRVEARRGPTLIEGADCACGWQNNTDRARENARRHAETTGHQPVAYVAYSVRYVPAPGQAGPLSDD